MVFTALGIGELISGPIITKIKGRISVPVYMIVYIFTVGIAISGNILNYYFKSFTMCFFTSFLLYV